MSNEINLHVITVVQNYGFGMVGEYFPKGWLKEISERSAEELERITSKYIPKDFKVTLHVERGVIYKAILDYADKIKADLIILPASQPDRRDYLLGPNAAKIVRHSDISVLVVR